MTSSIHVETISDFYSFRLNNTRPIEIFLPTDYARSNTRRYPVLYLNDGQDAPALHLAQTLEHLQHTRRIQPIIAVAVHATIDRMNEYGVSNIPNAIGRGALAADYAQFIVNEVQPYINHYYRTQLVAENTAIMGSSLGGLSAFDIAWHFPENFGVAGAFSASFWWRTDNSSWQKQQSSRIVHQVVRAGPKRSGLRFWLEAGTDDERADRDRNGVIDAIQDTLELIDELVKIGYERDRDIHYFEIKGGQHNQETWAKALPVFLQWAFPLKQNWLQRLWSKFLR